MEEYPGLIAHMRSLNPDDDDYKLLNRLLAYKMFRVAEYLARIIYGVAGQD